MNIPFFDALESTQHALLAGAGGGFDIFAGLPIYYSLRNAGKKVSLANLSFSHLLPTAGEHLTPDCVEITTESDGSRSYFPEKYLTEFLASRGDLNSIFAIRRTGCRPVVTAYQALLEHLQFDTLILIDGGTDSLMRSDEQGLGTPEEDSVSLIAARLLPMNNKFHACVGFGVDHFHGVCNAHAFEAIAELTRNGAFRGAFSITPEMPESIFFKDALDYTHSKMPNHPSIVNSSIASAIAGQFGNYQATNRTAGSQLQISPLMPIYWAFLLNPVADRLLYANAIRNTESYGELSLAIETFRAMLPSIRPYEQAIP